MSATLKLTHKTIGVEVRRGTYDAVLDGKRVGSVEMVTIQVARALGRWGCDRQPASGSWLRSTPIV
jgi:hypothetical protein